MPDSSPTLAVGLLSKTTHRQSFAKAHKVPFLSASTPAQDRLARAGVSAVASVGSAPRARTRIERRWMSCMCELGFVGQKPGGSCCRAREGGKFANDRIDGPRARAIAMAISDHITSGCSVRLPPMWARTPAVPLESRPRLGDRVRARARTRDRPSDATLRAPRIRPIRPLPGQGGSLRALPQKACHTLHCSTGLRVSHLSRKRAPRASPAARVPRGSAGQGNSQAAALRPQSTAQVSTRSTSGTPTCRTTSSRRGRRFARSTGVEILGSLRRTTLG